MRFTQFLLNEGREEYITQQLGPKIMKRYNEDNGKKPDFDNPLSIIQYLSKIHPKYIQWIVKQYVEGNFKLEDRTRIKGELDEFDRIKPQLEQKDINQYKTLKDLYNIVDTFSGKEVVSANQIKKEIKDKGADKLIDNAEILMYKIKTKEAAMLLGKGTRWCTAATKDNMFNHYNQDGPLYVIIDKESNNKYQLHLESKSCMDAEDDECNLDVLFTYDLVKEILSTLIDLPTTNPESIISFACKFALTRYISSDKLAKLIKDSHNNYLIHDIPVEDRTKEICLAAFNNFVGAYVAFPEKFKTLDLSIKYAMNLPTGSTWEAIPEKHRSAVKEYLINLRTIKSKANLLKRSKEFNKIIQTKAQDQRNNPQFAEIFKGAEDDVTKGKQELAGFKDYVKQLRQQKREMAGATA